MGLPTSLIFLWPGTNATIPNHWVRETALDNLYPFAIPEAQAGSVGAADGFATHTHVGVKSAHTISAGASSGMITPTVSGTKYAAATDGHTHGNSTSSVTTNYTTGSAVNDPVHIDVIFIKPADGVPTGVPPNAWSFFSKASLPGDWSLPTQPKGVLLRGAVAAGDSHLSHLGSATHSHTTNHTHTAKASAAATGGTANRYPIGVDVAAANVTHTHAVSLSSGGVATSEESAEPGWQKVAVIQNDAGVEDLPDGVLALYLGALGDIPDGWAVYPIVNDYAFLKGASDLTEINDVGGETTFEGHDHAGNAHDDHGPTAGFATTACGTNGSGAATAVYSHTHAAWTVGSATDSIGVDVLDYPPCLYSLLLKYTKPAAAIAGAAAGTGTASGTATGSGAIAGAGAGASTPAGSVSGSGAVAGTAAGSTTPSGMLQAAGEITGGSIGSATATAALVCAGELAGSSEGSATASGAVAGDGFVAGSAEGLATASGTVTAIATDQVAGVAAGAATVTGSILATGTIAGLAAGSARAIFVVALGPLARHFGIRAVRPGSTGARSTSSVHHASRTCPSTDSRLCGSRRET